MGTTDDLLHKIVGPYLSSLPCPLNGVNITVSKIRGQGPQEFVTPEDFAGLVAFLASPNAARTTGQSIVCDGGGLLH